MTLVNRGLRPLFQNAAPAPAVVLMKGKRQGVGFNFTLLHDRSAWHCQVWTASKNTYIHVLNELST